MLIKKSNVLKTISIISLFITIATLLIIYLINFLDYNRINYILYDAIGEKNIEYLHKLDEKIFTGIGGADETYIYKITDTKIINCTLFEKYKEIEFPDSSEKEYINFTQPICEYTIPNTASRFITIKIQNEILILSLVY